MSVTSGGTAPNGLRAGGSASAAAGSAGIVITLSARQLPASRLHRQTEADRSSVLTTTPTKPQVALGSCDGRSSSLQHVEGVVVEHGDTARSVGPVAAAKARHEDAVRAAVQGVRAGVAGAFG